MYSVEIAIENNNTKGDESFFLASVGSDPTHRLWITIPLIVDEDDMKTNFESKQNYICCTLLRKPCIQDLFTYGKYD